MPTGFIGTNTTTGSRPGFGLEAGTQTNFKSPGSSNDLAAAGAGATVTSTRQARAAEAVVQRTSVHVPSGIGRALYKGGLCKLCCRAVHLRKRFVLWRILRLRGSSKLPPGPMVPARAWVLDGSLLNWPLCRSSASLGPVSRSSATFKLSIAARRRLWLTPEQGPPCPDRCTPNIEWCNASVKLTAQTNASARQARRRLELPKAGTPCQPLASHAGC